MPASLPRELLKSTAAWGLSLFACDEARTCAPSLSCGGCGHGKVLQGLSTVRVDLTDFVAAGGLVPTGASPLSSPERPRRHQSRSLQVDEAADEAADTREIEWREAQAHADSPVSPAQAAAAQREEARRWQAVMEQAERREAERQRMLSEEKARRTAEEQARLKALRLQEDVRLDSVAQRAAAPEGADIMLVKAGPHDVEEKDKRAQTRETKEGASRASAIGAETAPAVKAEASSASLRTAATGATLAVQAVASSAPPIADAAPAVQAVASSAPPSADAAPAAQAVASSAPPIADAAPAVRAEASSTSPRTTATDATLAGQAMASSAPPIADAAPAVRAEASSASPRTAATDATPAVQAVASSALPLAMATDAAPAVKAETSDIALEIEEDEEPCIAHLKGLVLQIYEEHEEVPEDVPHAWRVNHLFQKYRGLERELYVRICRKFAVEPDPAYMPAEEQEARQQEAPAAPPGWRGVLQQAWRKRTGSAATPSLPGPDGGGQLGAFLKAKGFGDDVNKRRRWMLMSYYPLHAAVKQNNGEIVQLLLAARADPSLCNSSGRTPAQLAHRCNRNGSHAAVLRALGAAE